MAENTTQTPEKGNDENTLGIFSAKAAAAAPDTGSKAESAPAKEPVVKAPARSSESELDIMVEE